MARLGCGRLGSNLRRHGEELHCLWSLHEQGTRELRSYFERSTVCSDDIGRSRDSVLSLLVKELEQVVHAKLLFDDQFSFHAAMAHAA
jgi:hypothetical protein